jgi:hypothetical protein
MLRNEAGKRQDCRNNDWQSFEIQETVGRKVKISRGTVPNRKSRLGAIHQGWERSQGRERIEDSICM